MTDYRAPVDLEETVIGYLGPLLEDLLDPEHVSGKLRRGWTKGDRAVRITRTGGSTLEPVGYVDRARIQIEAFAEDDPSAFEIASLALLELRRLPSSDLLGVVVTAVEQDLGIRRQPDPVTEASRYLLGVILTAHPIGS